MPKIDLKKLIFGIIIVLGAALLLLALGMKVASKPETDNNQAASCSADSKTGVPCGGVVAVENTKIQYIVDKEGIPDGTGGVYQKLTFNYDLGKGQASQTVFSVLKDLADKNKFEVKYNNNYKYGVFIESIAGIKNGDGGKYWQYYINGKLGDVAADKKEVKAGDKVEWRFEKVPEM